MRSDPLSRALVGPARVAAGYAAAVCSWQLVAWLASDAPWREAPRLWLVLTGLLVVCWRQAGRTGRRFEAGRARGSPGAREAP